MTLRSLIISAAVIAAAEVTVVVTAVVSVPMPAMLVIVTAVFAFAVAAGLTVNRLESQTKAFVALVEKCAMDQDVDYFADLVPDDVLAAAGLKRGAL